MSPLGRKGALLALAAVALALVVAACGEEEFAKTHVNEGEPIELGDLHFNVQLTRFLNPNDAEDAAYLKGEPAAPPGESYLGVFMEVKNKGNHDITLPSTQEMKVIDTTDATYEPLEVETVFGFPFDQSLKEGESVPAPDSPAAEGPINGSVAIFLVSDRVSENRPLELELLADGEKGTVELDL
jgi:hypothetical protein